MRSTSPENRTSTALKSTLDSTERVSAFATPLRQARALVTGLDKALPVALLPVRLETRFFEADALGAARLCVRIYPDTLQAEAADLSTMLPGAWMAFAWGGNQPIGSTSRARFTLIGAGKPVKVGLSLGPHDDHNRGVADLGTSAETGWLVDYAEAEAVGMAITLPLTKETTGVDVRSVAKQIVIDQLVVVGARAGADFDRRLGGLMQGWVIAPGTPTNVLEGAPQTGSAGLSTSKALAPGDRSELAGADDDGALLASALGMRMVPLVGSSRREQAGEASVNALLWPTTALALRERVPELKEATKNTDDLEALRRHLVGYVRSQGPLPTLVVDDQPYGFLPVMAPRPDANPRPTGADDRVIRGLTAALDALTPRWASAAKRVPALDVDASDTDDDEAQPTDLLASVLLRNPLPETLTIGVLAKRSPGQTRTMVSNNIKGAIAKVHAALTKFVGIAVYKSIATSAINAIPADPTGRTFAEIKASLAAISALVKSGTDSANPTLRGYGTSLQSAARELEELLKSIPADTLGVVGDVFGESAVVPAISDLLELVEKSGSEATRWRRDVGADEDELKFLQTTMNFVAANIEAGRTAPDWSPRDGDSLFFYLLTPVVRGTLTGQARTDAVLALRLLAEADRADLNRWVAAGLDLFSTRLDAWITSLATRRLHTMRKAKATGLQLGGYGVVLGLKPRTELVASAQLAPTVGHVLTNSVLHAAHNTYSKEGASASDTTSPFTVTLTSERVRRGQWLIDGVRQGQTLSDLLGELFEDELQADGKADLIDVFREATRGKIQRRVDGLLLARRWRGETSLPLKKALALNLTEENKIKSSRAGLCLLDAMDSVYDVGLYESAHAFTSGNKERGAALLSALDRGEAPPPGPYALSSPNVGLTLRHRMILSLPTDKTAAVAGSWALSGLPAVLSPFLEGYLRRVLPDASTLTATISWLDADGADVQRSGTVSLAGFGALQFIRDAVAPAQFQGSPLARRLAAQDAASRWETLREVKAARATLSASSALEEALLLGQALRAALDGARVATPESFTVSEEGAQAPSVTTEAVTSINTWLNNNPPPSGDPRERWAWLVAVDRLGLNTPALPIELPSDPNELTDEALGVVQEAVRASQTKLAAGGSPEAVAEALGWRLPLVQRSFKVPVIGLHAPSSPPDAAALGGWLSALARVRAPAERVDRLVRLCDLINANASPTMSIIQYDHALTRTDAVRPWLGAAAPKVATGRRDLLHGVVLGAPAQEDELFAGLVLDAWTEQLPLTHQTVGVGLHWDAPTSRPPNVVLLAVPPEGEAWSAELLAETVLHAVELAKLRLVDTAELDAVMAQGERAVLPGVLLTNKTIDTGALNEALMKGVQSLVASSSLKEDEKRQATAAIAEISGARQQGRT